MIYLHDVQQYYSHTHSHAEFYNFFTLSIVSDKQKVTDPYE